MARVTLRLDFSNGRQVGPGKVRLLELVGAHGSISAAGRAMGMSYRRAWLLVDQLNGSFREPLVETQLGGPGGGGAALTELGREVVAHYRAIEAAARLGAGDHLQALEEVLGAASRDPRGR